MIKTSPVWFYLINNTAEHSKVVGKWIWQAPVKLFLKHCHSLDELVEQGLIPSAKFARKDPVYDPFPHDYYVNK